MQNIELIRKIHAKNQKMVLAIAGGGAEVIGELLRHGQGSNTLLEAIVPYCQKAYEEFIGGPPDKFVSEEAAAQLAMAAWQRGKTLQGSHDVIGIGATCALAKENERAGREHRVWVARQHHDKCITLGFNVNASREEEETTVANAILREVALGCDVPVDPIGTFLRGVFLQDAPDVTVRQYTLPELTCALYRGGAWHVAHHEPGPRKLILPGSFNPIHAGHINMAKIAKDLCPAEWCSPEDKVHFELSVRNVDKPWLTYRAIQERTKQYETAKETSRYKDCMGSLILTNAPLFVQKAEMFPGCVFIVGYDTFARISNCKYYKSPADMQQKFDFFHENGVKWIVFPRKKADGTISTEDDVKCLLNLPGTSSYYVDCPVFIVPNDAYPEEIHHISSTEIRKTQ